MLFLFLQSQSAIIRVYITSENYGILISQMEWRYFNVVTMNSHTWVYYIYDVIDSLPFNPTRPPRRLCNFMQIDYNY